MEAKKLANEEESLSVLLKTLSHPLRRRMLKILESKNTATFTELLFLCSLDDYYQKGLLDYHLKILSEAGIVAKVGSQYALSGLGRKVTTFFSEISSEHRDFLASREERSKERTQGGEKLEGKKIKILQVLERASCPCPPDYITLHTNIAEPLNLLNALEEEGYVHCLEDNHWSPSRPLQFEITLKARQELRQIESLWLRIPLNTVAKVAAEMEK